MSGQEILSALARRAARPSLGFGLGLSLGLWRGALAASAGTSRRMRALPLLPARPSGQTDAPTLGRIGNLEVRLARTGGEVRLAQSLRYRVFFEDGTATPDARNRLTRRDADRFDAISDHMLVLDHDHMERTLTGTRPAVVGTYRLLKEEVAARHDGFYSAAEFDLAPMLDRHQSARFLELGRSCVLKPYRTKRTVELLWHGIWSYVRRNASDVMIGCASFEGTDPDAHGLALSFLHHHAAPPPEWAVRALPTRYVAMNRMAKEAIDVKRALAALPPLIKGYLRLGAFVGDGAVVDEQFGTTDVMIILPVAAISERYINYYGMDATRHAHD